MKHSNINLHYIWLLSGLFINGSASKRIIPSDVTETPPLNTPLQSVPNKTFTTLSPKLTMDRRKQIVYSIGKSLCPYNDYCRRQKEFLSLSDHPCCGDCSCEDNCWETKTCCPDKEVIDTREPTEICHATIVKKRNRTVLYNGINYGIKAYRIIDDCPESERNISIINKCTLLDIDHIIDYNWVSNNSTGTIYQNKFCAACHGEQGLTEWRMEARCEDVLHSNFSQLKSLLLSEKCDVINREPSGNDSLYKRCAFPFYTHCNQTGLWEKYDPDIVWACNIHDATFLQPIFENIYLYKNAFCYACNQREIQDARTSCKTTISNIRDDGRLVFSALIDYKRDDYIENYQPVSEFACEVDEIFDPYLQTCRKLICPFSSTPFYGKCEKLVEKTSGLSVEVIYTLTVLWSNKDIFLTDEMATFEVLGKKVLNKLQDEVFKSGDHCRFCKQYLRLLKNIEKSTNSYDSNINTGNSSFIDPNLLIYSLWHTDEVCNLQKLTNDAIKFSEALIQIEDDGKRALSLKVALLKEDAQPLILSGKVITERQRYPDCYVSYKLKTEELCPQTEISFSEFEHFMTEHNADIIKSMFTTVQMRSKEYKDICVADYFEKLSNGNFKLMQNCGTVKSRMKLYSTITILITHLIKMVARLLL